MGKNNPVTGTASCDKTLTSAPRIDLNNLATLEWPGVNRYFTGLCDTFFASVPSYPGPTPFLKSYFMLIVMDQVGTTNDNKPTVNMMHHLIRAQAALIAGSIDEFSLSAAGTGPVALGVGIQAAAVINEDGEGEAEGEGDSEGGGEDEDEDEDV